MALNLGEMRHTVRLEYRTTVQDASGEPLLTWNLFQVRRASIIQTPGRELWTANQRESRVPTLFRLRFLEGVKPAMRLVFNERIFNIISAIDPDGLRVELVITAEELVEEPSP